MGIAKGWTEKNLPGWTDDIHRALLERHGAAVINDRISASSLSLPQLGAVLDDYESRGWVRQKTFRRGDQAGKPKKVSAQIGLMVKLWGKLGDAGKIKKATRSALLSFCARQTAHDVVDLDSLTTEEGQAIIEAIKAMLGR